MKKKPILERLGDFMEGKGFYIVLFLCVAAIGISGYYLFSSLDLGGGDVAVAAPTQVVVTPAPTGALQHPHPHAGGHARAGDHTYGLHLRLARSGPGGGRLVSGGAGL